MAQRVTRKKIKTAVGVSWFFVNIYLNFCDAFTCGGV